MKVLVRRSGDKKYSFLLGDATYGDFSRKGLIKSLQLIGYDGTDIVVPDEGYKEVEVSGKNLDAIVPYKKECGLDDVQKSILRTAKVLRSSKLYKSGESVTSTSIAGIDRTFVGTGGDGRSIIRGMGLNLVNKDKKRKTRKSKRATKLIDSRLRSEELEKRSLERSLFEPSTRERSGLISLGVRPEDHKSFLIDTYGVITDHKDLALKKLAEVIRKYRLSITASELFDKLWDIGFQD